MAIQRSLQDNEVKKFVEASSVPGQPAIPVVNPDGTNIGGSGGTSSADEAAFTPASSSGTPLMGARDDTSPDTVAEDKLGIARITTYRAVHVNLRDANGDEVAVGGGTQYTEDAAAAANPVGNALNLIRADTLAGVTSTDGDNVAARGTDKGELYVKHVDAIPVTDNGGTLTVDGTVAVTNAGITTIAGAVSGTEMQVDVVAALPAGTNNIGDVDIFSNTAKDGSGTRYQPLVDTDGHLQIDVLSGGGGGTQYTEADTDASITGTAIMWEDAADTLRAVSASKPLPVDIQDTTIAVTQSGTWDEVGINDSGNSITVDNGGTFAVQVDGSALTSLQLIDDVVATLGTTTYTETSTKGAVLAAVRRDADTTLVDTTNEIGPLQMNAAGQLKVEVFSGETLPVSLTSTTVTGTVAVTQSGTWDEVGINDSGNSITVDNATASNFNAVVYGYDGSGNPALSVDNTGAVKLAAGTNAIGKLAANSGVDIGDVDVTSISAGTNTIGNVGLIGRTSGGLTIFRSIDIDETEEEVKATAGQVFSITAFNRTAAPLYLKFYNATAANTTVGTTTPVLTFVVPANADSDGAGFVWNNDIGLAFGTAISVACTTGVADADTGAPGANDCIINIGYM